MKISTTVFALILLSLSITHPILGSGHMIEASVGSVPSIDGLFESEEWGDATRERIDVTVEEVGQHLFVASLYVKHNENHLFLAVYVPDTSCVDFDYVEVSFDPENHKSPTLLPDDLVFRIHRDGQIEQMWPSTSEPLFHDLAVGISNTSERWIIELGVPFEYLDIIPGETDVVGFALMVVDYLSSCPACTPYEGVGSWPDTYDYFESPTSYGDLSSSHQWIPEFASVLLIGGVVAGLLSSLLLRRRLDQRVK